MWNHHQHKVYSILETKTFKFKPLVILTGPLVFLLDSQLLDTAFFLENLLYHGKQRSRALYQGLPLKQNIEHLHPHAVKFNGSNICLKTWTSITTKQQASTVIANLRGTLHITAVFMKGLNILISIVMW